MEVSALKVKLTTEVELPALFKSLDCGAGAILLALAESVGDERIYDGSDEQAAIILQAARKVLEMEEHEDRLEEPAPFAPSDQVDSIPCK